MKEKPILFNGEMVRAILKGCKTQTRRPAKDDDPPYREGDVLYVRETWCRFFYDEDAKKWRYWYRADYPDFPDDRPDEWITGGDSPDKWHPSIHMPKDAARIFLKVVKVRRQRLRDISERDAKAEGVRWCENVIPTDPRFVTPRGAFERTWTNCYGVQSWENDPWVWVVDFERTEKR